MVVSKFPQDIENFRWRIDKATSDLPFERSKEVLKSVCQRSAVMSMLNKQRLPEVLAFSQVFNLPKMATPIPPSSSPHGNSRRQGVLHEPLSPQTGST